MWRPEEAWMGSTPMEGDEGEGVSFGGGPHAGVREAGGGPST